MGLRSRWGAAWAVMVITLFAVALGATPARASVVHVVQPGETLWSISAANDLTTRTVAVFNGISEDTQVVAGTTIDVPTVEEGAAALAAAGTAPAPATDTATSEPAAPATAAPPGLAYVYSPSGSVPLDPAAAASFDSMRQAALSGYGIDLYPAGLLSGYRTYDQQSYLYNLFLEGSGAPANPPGSSSHEIGVGVDLADPAMRSVVDEIGPTYGWYAPQPNEWWHIEYWG